MNDEIRRSWAPPVTDEELVAFMRGFLADNDTLPNAPTLAHRFGWRSINAAYERLLKLERRGVLERNAVGGWRFVRPTVEEQLATAAEVLRAFRGLGSPAP
jgi:hypothetical protein